MEDKGWNKTSRPKGDRLIKIDRGSEWNTSRQHLLALAASTYAPGRQAPPACKQKQCRQLSLDRNQTQQEKRKLRRGHGSMSAFGFAERKRAKARRCRQQKKQRPSSASCSASALHSHSYVHGHGRVRRPLLWISDIFRLPAAAAVPDRKTTLCCGFLLFYSLLFLFCCAHGLVRIPLGFGRPISRCRKREYPSSSLGEHTWSFVARILKAVGMVIHLHSRMV
jgi:hypothetical protein